MFWFYLCLGMVILAALLLTAGVCIWVYQDAKERGERAWLWVLIILISSPLLGGLVYLIARREERRPCRFCGWMLERDSHYCSHCGKQFPFCEPGSGYKEDLMLEHPKQKKRNRRYLALTAASAVMMVLSLVGMIFAVHSSGWEPEWNSGWVMMNLESNSGGPSGTVGQVKIITPLPDLHWRTRSGSSWRSTFSLSRGNGCGCRLPSRPGTEGRWSGRAG